MCSSPGNRSSSESLLGTHRCLERGREKRKGKEGGRGGGREIREGGKEEGGG